MKGIACNNFHVCKVLQTGEQVFSLFLLVATGMIFARILV